VRVTVLLTEAFFDLLSVLTITKMHLKIRECGAWAGGINHHRTVMTPDSPVGRFVRLDFSQDDIKLVSRVFGTQVLRRQF